MKMPNSQAAPRCYILDEDFKVKLAVRSSAADPLNGLYTPNCPIDALPSKIESVVRCLTAGWIGMQAADYASAVVDKLVVSVTPLHGPAGRHIGVFVESAS